MIKSRLIPVEVAGLHRSAVLCTDTRYGRLVRTSTSSCAKHSLTQDEQVGQRRPSNTVAQLSRRVHRSIERRKQLTGTSTARVRASQQTAPDAKIHAASRATSDAPPARPASPTKPTLSTAGKISQKFGRPLWNSTRPAPSAAAPPSANKRPVTPSGRRANTTLGDASAANATSFNATAIGADARGRPLRDENRPPLPTPASAGPKTLKHQSSILAGLGFGRVVSGESSQGRFVSAESTASTSPRKLLKPARVQFTDGAFAGYDPDKEPIKVGSS